MTVCKDLRGDPPETANETATETPAAATPIHDPTEGLLQSLDLYAKSPAEKASVGRHQDNLEQAMDVQGLIATGIVKNEREAILLRVGMAYSDFGKVAAYKEWITNANGHSIHPDGMINPSKELFAVLQGPEGAIWNDPQLASRKAFYEPLMKMMKGPVINPKFTHEEIINFTGAKMKLGNGFEIPRYPMIIGYFHEWQGLVHSYIDAQKAIQQNQGPLVGTVRNLDDYQKVFDSIYGHNGSGPSKAEFTDWFKKKYNREPKVTEIPFWTQAHETVKTNAHFGGLSGIFDNTIQAEKYAGSARPNKLSMFHRIMDRIDGVVDPEKIYEELAFMGARYPLVESYFGGNYHGPLHTQQYIIEKELEQMVEARIITREEAEILKKHAENQITLGKQAFAERAKKTRLYIDDKLVPIEEVGDRFKEVTHIELDTKDGTQRFAYKLITPPDGGDAVEKLVDSKGNVVDFMKLFKEEVARPATEVVKHNPNWKAGGDYCGFGNL